MGSTELKAALGRLAVAARAKDGRQAGYGDEGQRLSLGPGCAFGAVVEQRLKDIEADIAEVKGRLNGLIFLVVGAVVVDVVMRLAR